jgi:AcrR family transcriptional regulator
MFTKNHKRRPRGRPPGRTSEGDATRQRLYETAIGLFTERGYEAATLRDVAAAAGVSPTLLYRYFPNKRAIVLALYDELSEAFAVRAAGLPDGRWRDRFVAALTLSLEVLGPHRLALRALAPVLVGDADEGVFAEQTAFSRVRVQQAFERAVASASDAPSGGLAEPLGRLLYVLHLGVILWWLLDRSPRQRATSGLIGVFGQILPSAALTLRLPLVRRFVRSVDALVVDALLGTPHRSPVA